MKTREFVIQKKYGKKWKDYNPINETIPQLKNYLQAENELARFLVDDPGDYRIVSRLMVEEIIDTFNN